MKINTNAFINFVTKASLNGNIQTINIEFTDEGLLSSVMDASNTTLTITRLKLNAIEEYEKRPEIFIRNTPAFLKALKKLDEVFEFSIVEDYVMKLESGNRTGFIMLGSEMACENKRAEGEPPLEFDTTFKIDKGSLADTVQDTKDLSILQTTIEKLENKITFTVGQKGETDYFITTLDCEEKGTGKVKLGEMFLKTYSVLDNELEINIKTDAPAKIAEETEFVKFICIIAPIVDN